MEDVLTMRDQVGSDATAAAEARERYRTRPMATLAPDPEVMGFLGSGERIVAARPSAILDRRQPVGVGPLTSGLRGQFIVTSRRLLLVGRTVLSYELDDVVETLIGGGHLLVVMRDGLGFAIDVPQPLLLRVEIAAARTASRGPGEIG